MYNDYWNQEKRIGRSSYDMDKLLNIIMREINPNSVCDIGCGEGSLISKFINNGIKATGIDISETVVTRAVNNFGPHFQVGSILNIPFSDNSFNCSISTDCLEHLSPGDISQAVSELIRVSNSYIFIQVATTLDYEKKWHLTVKNKDWWSSMFFKHNLKIIQPTCLHEDEYDEYNNHPSKAYFIFKKI